MLKKDEEKILHPNLINDTANSELFCQFLEKLI